jgi:cytoskeletal protein CcmA (bactofilin family)
VIGQLYIEGDLSIAGIVEGEVEATGDVEIGDMAKVKASLAGGDVSIRGHLTGPVVARKRLIVARSGAVFGDVRVARLVIQDGATFSGKVSMGAGAVEAPTATAAKVVEATPIVVPEPTSKVAPEPAPKVAAPVPAVVVKPTPIAAAPAVQVKAGGKDGKAKGMPPKGKPKRR